MANQHKSYRELKSDLDEIMSWFDQDNLDVDLAMEKYRQAEALIVEIEKYLESVHDALKKPKK
jgi:exonuclease VII small subunit